jgi:hypothetical protein
MIINNETMQLRTEASECNWHNHLFSDTSANYFIA